MARSDAPGVEFDETLRGTFMLSSAEARDPLSRLIEVPVAGSAFLEQAR